jgi:cytochrome c oxidase assembly protein subunit 15
MPTHQPGNRFHTVASVALVLAIVVTLLGAYVRLSNAGLGCPDWPGCYGEPVVPESTALFPERPLEAAKAWKEMVHRYAAGLLGLLVLALALLAWRRDGVRSARPLTALLLGLVLFQALLGMWTVTLRLHPLVVMGHLLGGMAVTLTLFLLLRPPLQPIAVGAGTARLARLTLGVVALQIALGGWTSANYAAPSCPDFPTCQGEWWPEVDFADALRPELPPSRADFEGGTLHDAARTAIHLGHRLGALLTLLMVGLLALQLWREGPCHRACARLILGLAALQFAVGVGNVLWQFPLTLAVAHNGGAVLLLLATVAANLRLRAAAAPGLSLQPAARE